MPEPSPKFTPKSEAYASMLYSGYFSGTPDFITPKSEADALMLSRSLQRAQKNSLPIGKELDPESERTKLHPQN
jgi:hypothetical protein